MEIIVKGIPFAQENRGREVMVVEPDLVALESESTYVVRDHLIEERTL